MRRTSRRAFGGGRLHLCEAHPGALAQRGICVHTDRLLIGWPLSSPPPGAFPIPLASAFLPSHLRSQYLSRPATPLLPEPYGVPGPPLLPFVCRCVHCPFAHGGVLPHLGFAGQCTHRRPIETCLPP